jgi:thiamine biosynthesis protein ThiC
LVLPALAGADLAAAALGAAAFGVFGLDVATVITPHKY